MLNTLQAIFQNSNSRVLEEHSVCDENNAAIKFGIAEIPADADISAVFHFFEHKPETPISLMPSAKETVSSGNGLSGCGVPSALHFTAENRDS